MKKFKLLSLLLTILLLTELLAVPALAVDEPQISAPYAVVLDAATGNVLYERGSGDSFDPADSAVLMTALLVAEAMDAESISLNDEVVASDTFAQSLPAGSYVADPPITAGEIFTVSDLLYLALVGTAADACNVLGEFISGSVASFVSAMNERAGELGCTGTRFESASGSGAGQITTARDLAVIAQELSKHDDVVQICGAASHATSPSADSGSRTVSNTNALLDEDSAYYYGRATGLRAGGYTGAGYNAVVTAKDEETGVSVAAVVAGEADPDQRSRDAMTLLDWVFNNFSYRALLSTTAVLETISVALGAPDTVGVRPETPLTLLLPNDRELGEVQYNITYDYAQTGTELQAPVSAGQVLGTVQVLMDGEDYGTSRVLAASSVDISRIEYLSTQLDQLTHAPAVRQIFNILMVLLGIYLLLVVIYLIQRFRHLRSLRVAKKDRAIAQTQQAVEWLDIPEQEREYLAPDRGYDQNYDESSEPYDDEPYEQDYDENYRE